MRTFFWLTVAAYAVVWGWAFRALPDRVALHFGLTGEVDNWGSRGEALVLLAALGILMTAVLGGGAWLVGRARLAASWVNLPHKDWWTATPERVARARDMLRGDLLVVGGLTMALLTLVQLALVRTSRQDDPRMDPVTMAAVLLLVVVILGYTAWLTVWRYRPDGSQE
ncbi:DUF1648 domain-containing protein [Nocardioides panacisoli]|uniref:DUF1648 domain-containing protein n=1 Tax=Nocardioides panacisoli TaxID=627624 RepID=UPI001C632907|nr:DUF1648 domain-containing protein [Nocardioides panacisoli]QYJ03862.1 DUF1648 domain-containing protein [Nocardioides panacisoli]